MPLCFIIDKFPLKFFLSFSHSYLRGRGGGGVESSILYSDVDWSDDCTTTEGQVYVFAAFEKKMQGRLDSVVASALNDHAK